MRITLVILTILLSACSSELDDATSPDAGLPDTEYVSITLHEFSGPYVDDEVPGPVAFYGFIDMIVGDYGITLWSADRDGAVELGAAVDASLLVRAGGCVDVFANLVEVDASEELDDALPRIASVFDTTDELPPSFCVVEDCSLRAVISMASAGTCPNDSPLSTGVCSP